MANINEIVDPDLVNRLLKTSEALDNIAASMKKIIDSSEKANEEFKQTAASSEDAAKQGSEYAKLLNKAAEEQNKFTAATRELQGQQKNLTNIEAKLTTARSQGNVSLAEKKRQLKEEQELLKINTILNDKNAGSLEKAKASNKLLQFEKEKLIKTDKNYKSELKRINAEQDKNNELIAESSNKLQKQKINIGNYGSAFGGLLGQFKSGEIGLKGLVKGVFALGKAFITAIVTNPILLVVAAIVLAFKGFVDLLKSTDSGATALEAKMQQLKAIFEVVRLAAIGVMNGIKALFSGDREKAAEEFKNAVGGVGEKMREAAAAAKAYVYELDRIDDSQKNFISRAAEIQNEIAKLTHVYNDQTLTLEERQKALTRITELEREEADFKIKIAQDTYKNELRNLAVLNQVTEAEIEAFVRMSDAEQENASDRMKAARDANEAKFEELEKLYANMVNADTAYFENTKKIQKKLSDFTAQTQKEQADAAAKAAKIRADQIEKQRVATENLNKAISNTKDLLVEEFELDMSDMMPELDAELPKKLESLNNAIISQTATRMEIQYQQQLMFLRQTAKTDDEFKAGKFELDKQIVESNINSYKNMLSSVELTAERRIEIENQIALMQLDLQMMVYDKESEINAKRVEDMKAIQEASIQGISELFSFRSSMLDNELAQIEQKNKDGLLSDKEYARQKAEIEQKKAKTDRASALFNIGVNTAQAVSKIWAEVPKGDFGISTLVLTGLAIASGAMQAAAVLSKPIPAIPGFWMGTDSTPEIFTAGERGFEIMQTRSGDIFKVDKPTLFAGDKFKGARIKNNADSKAIMDATKQPVFINQNRTDDRQIALLSSIDKRLKQQKTPIYGSENKIVGYQQGNSITKFVNRYKYGC
jgi:hypothetical protein